MQLKFKVQSRELPGNQKIQSGELSGKNFTNFFHRLYGKVALNDEEKSALQDLKELAHSTHISKIISALFFHMV